MSLPHRSSAWPRGSLSIKKSGLQSLHSREATGGGRPGDRAPKAADFDFVHDLGIVHKAKIRGSSESMLCAVPPREFRMK